MITYFPQGGNIQHTTSLTLIGSQYQSNLLNGAVWRRTCGKRVEDKQRECQRGSANSRERVGRTRGTDDKTQVSMHQLSTVILSPVITARWANALPRHTPRHIVHIFGKHSQDPAPVSENHLGKLRKHGANEFNERHALR